MEDSLSYLNAVSEAGQALNQVTALKEAAQMQFEQKKQALGSEYQLGGEISLTAAGGYLGKKALGFISDQVKEGASQLASKVGISEETVGKALSGDISGAIQQGGQEITQAASEAASEVASNLVSGAESMIDQAGTGILGRVSSGLENIPSLSTPSISSDSSIGDIYTQGLEDLKSQMGIDDATFRDYTNISLNESRPFSYNTPQSGGGEVEMTDFAAQPAAAGSSEAATSEAVSTAAEAVAPAAESAGADVATTVGESVGESVAAEVGGDVASAVLGPIGGLVALGLGIWSFFHGEHEESSAPPPPVFTATLNPSAQFGAQMG